MKKGLLFLLLLSATLPAAATVFETTYGIGVLHLDFAVLTEIPLRNAADLKTAPEKTITFTVSGDRKSKTATLQTPNTDKWLAPELLQPENLLFSVRVLERQTGWFRVVVNNGSGKNYWVRNTEGLQFFSWSDEVVRAVSIVRTSRDTNPLRKFQSSSIILPWDPIYADCFRPLKVLGIWMEIETRETCADGTTKVKSAWIQWRDDEQLLVNYRLIP